MEISRLEDVLEQEIDIQEEVEISSLFKRDTITIEDMVHKLLEMKEELYDLEHPEEKEEYYSYEKYADSIL